MGTNIVNLRQQFPNALRNYSQPYNADDAVRERVKKVNETIGEEYHNQNDPFLLEQNLSDLGVLLDRILAHRRELNQIEAERIRTVLGYQATLEMVRIEGDIELARSSNPTEELKAAVASKIEAAKKSIQQLENQHSDVGSPLNFASRIGKLEAQMLDYVEAAVSKTKAVELGLLLCQYDFNIDTPKLGENEYVDFEGASYLDQWCAWYRRLSRRLEKAQRWHQMHEIALSLGKKWKPQKPLDAAAVGWGDNVYDWPTQLKTSRAIMRDVKAEMLPRTTMHLRSVAVSVLLPPGEERNWNFHANVTGPLWTDARKRFAVLPVGVFPERPLWCTDETFHNLKAVGLWSIGFLPNPLHRSAVTDDSRLNFESWPILDVILHLRWQGPSWAS